MKVFIERSKEECDSLAKTVAELLDELDLVSEEVLVVRNGKLVTESEPLELDDTIKILSVISGG